MAIQPSTNTQNSIVEETGMRKRTRVGASASVATIGSSVIKTLTVTTVALAKPIVAQAVDAVNHAETSDKVAGLPKTFWYFYPSVVILTCIVCNCCCSDKDKNR